MQTLNVQLLSNETLQQGGSIKPTNDVKKVNDGSFQSILESVKLQKADNKGAKVSDTNGPRPEDKAPKTDDPKNSETAASREAAGEQSVKSKKDEPVSRKNQKENKSDDKNLDEENSITVEIDAEEIVQDDNALAQSLAAASEVIQQEETNVAAEVSLNESAVAEVTEVSANENVENLAAQEFVAESDTEVIGIDEDALAQTLAVAQNDDSRKEQGAVQVAAVSGNVANVEADMEVSQMGSVEMAKVDADSRNGSAEKISEPTERKSVFNIIDQRTTEETSEKIALDDGKPSDNSTGNSLNFNQGLATSEAPVIKQDVQVNGNGFQQVLAQQIQNSAPEFVKAGNILLKDNNSGSINMILKPENLGNVKVSLELTDKILSGQIVVQSREAYEAFRHSMDTLRQAFQNNGFESANLSLVLAENSGSNGTFGQGQQQSGEQFMANKTYSDFAQTGEVVETSSGSDAYTKSGNHQIDVVA